MAAEVIAKANSIDDPSRLRAGMKLIIPGDAGDASSAPAPIQKYKVVKGDTLFSIAKSLRRRAGCAALGQQDEVHFRHQAGDTLCIPARGKAVAQTGAATTASTTAGTADPEAAVPEAPAVPSAVPSRCRTTAKAVNKSLTWPCPGEILYLDGKAYGIVIQSKLGEAEKAIAAGTVSSAGPYRGYGNVVFVLSRGYIYVYGGNETISVRAGDRVTAGQELGKVGMDAKQGGPAAYFLVFKNGQAVDPAAAPRD